VLFFEVTLRLTASQSVSQSVSMSWCRAPLWDLRPDIPVGILPQPGGPGSRIYIL
jgi:hypothetical protein